MLTLYTDKEGNKNLYVYLASCTGKIEIEKENVPGIEPSTAIYKSEDSTLKLIRLPSVVYVQAKP